MLGQVERKEVPVRIRVLSTAVAVGSALLFAVTGIASAGDAGMATGAVTWQGFGTPSISLVAQGTPTDASGWMQFRRSVEGFDANSGGPVLCYLQVGNRAYFSGVFARTFFSGPTEVRFFNGLVVDGAQFGEPDSVAVALSADAPIPCTTSWENDFLDAVATPVTRGNIVVH
jgi:hypothetical protein